VITDEELIERFAGYGVDHDTAAHLRGRLDRQLLINRCGSCGHRHHPPRPVCPQCWSDEITAEPVAGDGTIHLAIFLYQGPPATGVDYSTPYPLVTVDLDEQPGLRFSATVVGSRNEQVVIGTRVRLDWIERDGVPVPVFRLAA
jgi:uncharacterized OB-fold protein